MNDKKISREEALQLKKRPRDQTNDKNPTKPHNINSGPHYSTQRIVTETTPRPKKPKDKENAPDGVQKIDNFFRPSPLQAFSYTK